MSADPKPITNITIAPSTEERLLKWDVDANVSIESWLKIYELLTTNYTDEEKVRRLPLSLKGSAFEWFASDIIGQSLTWTQVKNRMTLRFIRATAKPLIQANRLHLKLGENVETYFNKKTKLLKQTTLSDPEICDLLTEGLPEHWRNRLFGIEIRSLNQWINLASELELMMNRQKPTHKQHKTFYTEQSTSKHSTSDGNKRPNTPCRYCKDKGQTIYHWHRECPNRSFNNTKPKSLAIKEDDETYPNCHKCSNESKSPSRTINDKAHGSNATFHTSLGPVFKLIDVPVIINGQNIRAFIDSGSTLSIISYKQANKLNLELSSSRTLRIGQALGSFSTIGIVTAPVTLYDITQTIDLHVVDGFGYPLLLGLDAGQKFRIKLDLERRKVTIPSTFPYSSACLNLQANTNARLDKILLQHKDIFAQHETDIGRISVAKHQITTVPHPPIQLRAYRRPQSEYDEISRQIKDLKEKGLIRDSDSPWAFPVTLAKKKDGTSRMCIDYRRLNTITIDDKMPLPRIDDILDRLRHAKYFTTLDVAWGYWHIEMDSNSINKTAFITHEGHYEWLVMPFGLKNAPSTFQRILQLVLGKTLYKGAINYLDDVIVYSDTLERHLQLLECIFKLFKIHNIKLKSTKCHFLQNKVEYLGYIVSHNKVEPSPSKIESVRSFPAPTSVTEVRRFLGLANYYRRFVPDFAKITKPLTALLRKDVSFNWSDEQQTAFDQLRKILTSKPVLALYDREKPCLLYTDASKVGIGAMLVQKDEKGSEHPIAYYSKALNKHESNYTAFELECLAVIRAVEHFQVYLSLPFTIITDHHALKWLLSLKNPTGKLYRWSIKLSTYNYTLIHKPGKSQQHVDALSRAPVALHLSNREVLEQQKNADLSFVKNPIIENSIVMIEHNNTKRIAVPESLRPKVLSDLHDDFSHPGRNKTIQLITRRYWWPKMIPEIKQYVSSCRTCQLVKQTKHPTIGKMQLPTSQLDPGDLVGLDTIVMGPAARNSKHQYIQVFVDHASRYVWAYPTIKNTSSSVTNLIDKLMSSGVTIKKILTDNHKNFTSNEIKRCLNRHNIKHLLSTPYHPQTNGIVERFNGTLITKLRFVLLDHPKRKWNTLLPKVVSDYNNTPHDVTGFTPAFLFFGKDSHPEPPSMEISEARKLAKSRTENSQNKRKERHDAIHPETSFKIGDQVIRIIPSNHPSVIKTSQKYSGPYFIISQISDNTFDISETLTGPTYRAHSSQLRPFVERRQNS